MTVPVSPYYAALGARLRDLRLQHMCSLRQIEARSGGQWKAVCLGAWERGDRRADPETLTGLAAWYGVSAGWLLTGQSDVGDVMVPAGATS